MAGRRKGFQAKGLKRAGAALLLAVVLSALIQASFASWLTFAPLSLPSPRQEIIVSDGLGASAIGRELAKQGVPIFPFWFGCVSRLTTKANRLKAGNYEIEQGLSLWGLIDVLARGDVRYKEFRIIEGWNFAQIRQAMANSPELAHDSEGLSDTQIMEKLGLSGQSPEGWFFPDTYLFARRTSDFSVLKRAYQRQQRELQTVWNFRQPDIPLKSPYEALILASIVEKETAAAVDRPKIASVFVNRLRIGMMLQTDPTVIYGLGNRFDGNLRKNHLTADTPYNTYTRTGLPPTPIATPSKAALLAAVKPDTTPYLYFVARGDGTSQFSVNLSDHNRAVNKFQRGL